MLKNSDTWMKDMMKSISHRSYITFFSAVAAGSFAHMYMLTNKLPNYDELTFGAEGIGETVASGRWGLEVIHQISRALLGGSYSLPWLSGLVTVILIAAASCYIVKFLDIRQDILCALTGGVMVTFPALTSAMFFMFTARYYALAILLLAWGLCRLDKGRNRIAAFAAAVVSVMLATSIFQAYYALAAGLCVIKLMRMCLEDDGRQYKRIFGNAWSCLFMLVLSMVCYIVSAKIAGALAGTGLSAYRGIEHMGYIAPGSIPGLAREVYESIGKLFVTDFYQTNPTPLLKLALGLVCAATAVLTVSHMLPKCRKREGILLTGELLVFTLILPFCINGIIIMQPDFWYYTLMEYGVVLIFLCPLTVLDAVLQSPKASRGKLKSGRNTQSGERVWTMTVSSLLEYAADYVITFGILLCVGIYIWFDNGNYVSMDFAYRSAESYFTSMLTQVRMTEGYTDETPVYVLGWDSEIEDKSFSANRALDVFNIGGKNDSLVHAWNWYAFMNTYLGYWQFDWDEETINELWMSPEVEGMPCYPDQGAIARVGDGIVIKIANKE